MSARTACGLPRRVRGTTPGQPARFGNDLSACAHAGPAGGHLGGGSQRTNVKAYQYAIPRGSPLKRGTIVNALVSEALQITEVGAQNQPKELQLLHDCL